MHKYFLLYKEMTHSMNFGNIGQIETLFLAWIALFKATGKHKYASSMCKYLNDVHWVYPRHLSHAIHYNILVNPTGKEGAFRAPDWVQEYHNLKTKVGSFAPHMVPSHSLQVICGGRGSNYTKERVLQESSLIEVFHTCHRNIEHKFFTGWIDNTTYSPGPDKDVQDMK
jgi:hypothetical protein